jgi:hypothetical protein
MAKKKKRKKERKKLKSNIILSVEKILWLSPSSFNTAVGEILSAGLVAHVCVPSTWKVGTQDGDKDGDYKPSLDY